MITAYYFTFRTYTSLCLILRGSVFLSCFFFTYDKLSIHITKICFAANSSFYALYSVCSNCFIRDISLYICSYSFQYVLILAKFCQELFFSFKVLIFHMFENSIFFASDNSIGIIFLWIPQEYNIVIQCYIGKDLRSYIDIVLPL